MTCSFLPPPRSQRSSYTALRLINLVFYLSKRLVFHFRDGTLTDSIAAVEAAWGAVARELGLPEHDVIAATHGKRAIDNLASYKPWITKENMDAEVEAVSDAVLSISTLLFRRERCMEGVRAVVGVFIHEVSRRRGR